MITLNNVSKRIGPRTLFEGISITFNRGIRYGLTGPNGAGKSTLLRIIIGQEEATSGTVSLPKRVGYLRQNIEAFSKMRVIDVVIMGNTRLWKAFQERDALYEKEMTDAVGIRLGELEEVIGEEDGYGAESDAEILLLGMAVPREYHEETMSTIPSDMQFKVLLCQALFGQPQALLLDEPTNHLDLDSIGWLEQFLHNYPGVLIVVSHDRHFLNAITTAIADIDYDTLIIYPGNYDQMIVAKMAVRERTEAENKSKEKKVAQLREFVAKFGAGTRASQVQSRIREITKLQPQEMKQSNIQRPYIRFYPSDKSSGQLVFKIQNISKSYAQKSVINNFSHEITRGERIAVIGNNGRGKTTLLKMLAGVTPPDSGKIEVGFQTYIGYFPQNHGEVVDKSSPITAFEWLKAKKPGVYDQEIRSVLGKMLFAGEDAFKPLSALSGGETARLILGGMMLGDFNTLLFDEPNNHLDLEAVSALAWALEEFKGTVLLASHDRDLISKVATQVIALEADGIRCFNGPFEEYLSTKR
jgi:ATPase subunit of ABC transporter with duplicated ATPase domains